MIYPVHIKGFTETIILVLCISAEWRCMIIWWKYSILSHCMCFLKFHFLIITSLLCDSQGYIFFGLFLINSCRMCFFSSRFAQVCLTIILFPNFQLPQSCSNSNFQSFIVVVSLIGCCATFHLYFFIGFAQKLHLCYVDKIYLGKPLCLKYLFYLYYTNSCTIQRLCFMDTG